MHVLTLERKAPFRLCVCVHRKPAATTGSCFCLSFRDSNNVSTQTCVVEELQHRVAKHMFNLSGLSLSSSEAISQFPSLLFGKALYVQPPTHLRLCRCVLHGHSASEISSGHCSFWFDLRM